MGAKMEYSEIVDLDIVEKLRPLLKSGYYFDMETGLIKAPTARAWDMPWIYTNPCKQRNCIYYFTVLFGRLSVLPKKCTECWKVVVRPRTFHELVQLMHLQEEQKLRSKCGTEVRSYVHGLYGGYYYNDSLDEGRCIYQIVKHDVSKIIGPDVQVILKRGCTELEYAFGPSNKWKRTERDERLETLANGWVDSYTDEREQAGIIKLHIYRKWMEFAWEHGDDTVMAYNGGKPLTIPYVTYHEEAHDAALAAEGD